MIRYFLEGDKLLALEDGRIRQVREVFQLTDDSMPLQLAQHADVGLFGLAEKPNKTKAKKTYKKQQPKSDAFTELAVPEETEQPGKKYSVLDDVTRQKVKATIVADELSPKEIAEKFNVSVANIYVIKHGMRKAGELKPKHRAGELSEEDHDIEDRPGANEEVGDDLMAHQIRELWAETDSGAALVCAKLKISLTKFNRIITTHKISKPQR